MINQVDRLMQGLGESGSIKIYQWGLRQRRQGSKGC
jgi:hypothetical protein